MVLGVSGHCDNYVILTCCAFDPRQLILPQKSTSVIIIASIKYIAIACIVCCSLRNVRSYVKDKVLKMVSCKKPTCNYVLIDKLRVYA